MPITAAQIGAAQARQHAAAHDTSPQARVVAGPGTGKSFAIEERVRWLLAQAVASETICAVSFTQLFAKQYEIFYDNSLDGRIRSDDPEYINRAIREENIVGSSITIFLCGAETWKRKYVDWEIHSTLHHKHALMGIALPTAVRGSGGGIIVPDRLHENIKSGFAYWLSSWRNDPAGLSAAMKADGGNVQPVTARGSPWRN